jgi:hypothetical protein
MVHTKITFNGQQRVAINMQGKQCKVLGACALYIWIAGQWALEGHYINTATANHMAKQYKRNKRRLEIFTDMILHRRKYPVAR